MIWNTCIFDRQSKNHVLHLKMAPLESRDLRPRENHVALFTYVGQQAFFCYEHETRVP